MTNWDDKKQILIKELGEGDEEKVSYVRANAEAINGALAGRGPDDSTSSAAGAVMVANISSTHVPAFCQASRSGDSKPYKNTYDLGKHVVGDRMTRRVQVDAALPINFSYCEAYFGAVAITGAGVGFYGDICLVLKPSETDLNRVILDRNSYDLIRSPLKERIKGDDTRRKEVAADLAGSWGADLSHIGTVKVLERRTATARRLTTGQIAEVILDDEDYIEVLRNGSFGSADLLEARTSAASATLEERIERRLQHGPAPTGNDLLWLKRRRRAEKQLRNCGIELRVVTTTGRAK